MISRTLANGALVIDGNRISLYGFSGNFNADGDAKNRVLGECVKKPQATGMSEPGKNKC